MQSATDECRLSARVMGRVQGVGFRLWARRQAQALGLRGYVRNLPDGAVEVIAEGPRALLDQLLDVLRRGPPGAQVRAVETTWGEADGAFSDFRVVH